MQVAQKSSGTTQKVSNCSINQHQCTHPIMDTIIMTNIVTNIVTTIMATITTIMMDTIIIFTSSSLIFAITADTVCVWLKSLPGTSRVTLWGLWGISFL